MNRSRIALLLVRLLFFGWPLGLQGSLGAEPPPAPANHLYDPDFLLSRTATSDLSKQLKRFEQSSDVKIYLALYTTPPRPIEETAQDLNQAWNQSGYGALIAFAPHRAESRVLPSPQLSLIEDADRLSAIFRDAAQPGMTRGDDSAAAVSGVEALMKRLGGTERRLTPPPKARWHLTRLEILLLLAGLALAGLVFLWFAARVWRAANLFGHSYRFPDPPKPAMLRLGGRRCGGRLATSKFRPPAKS